MIRDLENNLINLRDGANRHRLLLGKLDLERLGSVIGCWKMHLLKEKLA